MFDHRHRRGREVDNVYFHGLFPFVFRLGKALLPIDPGRPFAKLAWRLAERLFEGAAEGLRVLKTGVQRDVNHRLQRVIRQAVRGAFEPHPLDITPHRDATIRAKLALKVKARKVGHFAQFFDGERLVQVAVDIVKDQRKALCIRLGHVIVSSMPELCPSRRRFS